MTPAAPVLHPWAIAQVMVNFAAKHGVGMPRCLEQTGIDPAQIGSEYLIPRAQELRLIRNIIAALPDHPALGFELGLQYSMSTFGLWGFALRTSQTLRQAVETALRYLPLSTAYCDFSIAYKPQEVCLLVDAETVPEDVRRFLLERDMATASCLLQELSLSGIHLKALRFAGPAPAYADRLAELSEVQPEYGGDANALVLHPQDLELPLPMYDAALVRMFEDQCRAQLERRQPAGLEGEVRHLLLGPLGLVSTLEDVAQALAMSPRSLRRKLDEAGTSFRAIADQERRLLAQSLLRTTEMTLDEIALQLGYTDTASFSRACRRWFSQSAGEYRQQHTL